jgi:hypothetical protein
MLTALSKSILICASFRSIGLFYLPAKHVSIETLSEMFVRI